MTETGSELRRTRDRLVLFILVVNIGVVVGSILAGYQKGNITFFFRERETVTFLSALQMGMAALASFLLYSIHGAVSGTKPSLFWLFAGFGFLWLTADEWFLIHEGIDDGLLGALGYVPEGRHFLFDWMVIALYGVGTLILVIWYHREILATRARAYVFAAAAALYVVQTAADAFEAGAALTVVEEGSKLLSVSLFFLFFLVSFLETTRSVSVSVREARTAHSRVAPADRRSKEDPRIQDAARC